jgi:hypothetical protein
MTEPASSSVPEIIADLQAEVRRFGSARQAASGDLGGHDPDPLSRVRLYQHVNSHLPIGWPDMPPGLLPKLRAYAQKIVRRLLRWYINPLVDQQNRFNTAVTEVLAGLSLQIERQEQLLQELQRRAEREERSLKRREG